MRCLQARNEKKGRRGQSSSRSGSSYRGLEGREDVCLWTPEADVRCTWLGPCHFVLVLGTTTLDTDFKVKETWDKALIVLAAHSLSPRFFIYKMAASHIVLSKEKWWKLHWMEDRNHLPRCPTQLAASQMLSSFSPSILLLLFLLSFFPPLCPLIILGHPKPKTWRNYPHCVLHHGSEHGSGHREKTSHWSSCRMGGGTHGYHDAPARLSFMEGLANPGSKGTGR